MPRRFEVGLTCDFLTPAGELPYRDIGLDLLRENPEIRVRFMEPHPMELTAEHLRGYDAILSMSPRYTPDSFKGVDRLLLIARFGVGFDWVDVPACTRADVALCTSRGAVDHSMAEGILAWMFALSYRIRAKDRLLREGRWKENIQSLGHEIRGRRLGIIGLGGIGRMLARKVSALGMEPPMACDPFADPSTAREAGVLLVPLDTLLKECDFVCVCCPLTEHTRNLVGRDQLAMMRPEAFLINAARGPIVDETALVEALRENRIAGAAVDVFAEEPAGPDHPLAVLDNVLLAPHCVGFTHEMFREIGRLACASVVQASRGELPDRVVNRDVLDRPGFRRKLQARKLPVPDDVGASERR
jgi:phosphoglycerate dehydrogenase-like enzyme